MEPQLNEQTTAFPRTNKISNNNCCVLCYTKLFEYNKSLIDTIGPTKTTLFIEIFCKLVRLPSTPYHELLMSEDLLYCSSCIQSLQEIYLNWLELERIQTKLENLKTIIEGRLLGNGQVGQNGEQTESNSIIPSYSKAYDNSDSVVNHGDIVRKQIIQELQLVAAAGENTDSQFDFKNHESIRDVVNSGYPLNPKCPESSNTVFRSICEEHLSSTCTDNEPSPQKTWVENCQALIIEDSEVVLKEETLEIDFSNFNQDEVDESYQDLWAGPEDTVAEDIRLLESDRLNTSGSSRKRDLEILNILSGKKQPKVLLKKVRWDEKKDRWLIPRFRKRPLPSHKTVMQKRKKCHSKQKTLVPTPAPFRHRRRTRWCPCAQPECKRWFKDSISRDAHMTSAHGGDSEPYKCSFCDRTFVNRTKWDIHMNNHRGEKPFVCEHCGTGFSALAYLKRHIVSVHGITTNPKYNVTCTVCQKLFTARHSLAIHMRCHTGEKPFLCEVCSTPFRRNEDLRNHQRKFHADELNLSQIKCNLCSKTFTSLTYLRTHERLHTGKDIPFNCDVCPFQCFGKNRFEIHQKVHSDSRDYICNVEGCNTSFKHKGQLQLHMRRHNKDRRHKCPECDKTFLTADNRKNHFAVVHRPDSKEFKCEICGEGFPIRKYLMRHLERHRNGRLPNTQLNEVEIGAEAENNLPSTNEDIEGNETVRNDE